MILPAVEPLSRFRRFGHRWSGTCLQRFSTGSAHEAAPIQIGELPPEMRQGIFEANCVTMSLTTSGNRRECVCPRNPKCSGDMRVADRKPSPPVRIGIIAILRARVFCSASGQRIRGGNHAVMSLCTPFHSGNCAEQVVASGASALRRNVPQRSLVLLDGFVCSNKCPQNHPAGAIHANKGSSSCRCTRT